MAEDRDVRFVTEESFDFGVLSPSDSQEEEEDEESPGGECRRGGGNGRWSPLRGARLEEMVREATRLAAQLEGCHLPPPAPGDPPGPAATPPGTPRSPRRQTFVVKDSPVRALLPTVESQGPTPTPRPPAKPRGTSTATGVPKAPPSRHSTAAPKGPSGGRGLPPSRVGTPRPCPPQGQGPGARGRSEPPRGGTAGTDGEGTGTPWPWGLLGHSPTPLSPQASLRQGGAQSPAPPPPASPKPGAPPPLSPLAVPRCPPPSPRYPPGLQQQVGGPRLPEAWGWHGRPPQLLPWGANQDRPPPACGPPARRR